jgi:hypothetical protein
MAKRLRFKEAALLAQETAAAADEGKLQAMMFAMLQEQHNRQIVAMTATNKANMDAMIERMNALVAGGVGRRPSHQDKESTPTVGNPHINGIKNNPAQETNEAQVHLSPLQKFNLHKPKNCVEFKANKDKRWPGWKLVHTIA